MIFRVPESGNDFALKPPKLGLPNRPLLRNGQGAIE
jgi:hypothetical protein